MPSDFKNSGLKSSAAGDVSFVADGSNGDQSHGASFGQRDAREKGVRGRPIFGRNFPIVLVAESRGPVRGRNDSQVGAHDVEKIERFGFSFGLRAVVGRGSRDHLLHRGGIGGALHLIGDLFAAGIELAAKLIEQLIAAFGVDALKSSAGRNGYGAGHQRDRAGNGQRRDEQKLGAKSQGFSPESSQTSGIRGQLLTLELSDQTFGTSTNGTTRNLPSNARSVS